MINYTNKYMITIVVTALKEKCRVQCESLNGGHRAGAGDLGWTQNPLTDVQLCLTLD